MDTDAVCWKPKGLFAKNKSVDFSTGLFGHVDKERFQKTTATFSALKSQS